jgi:hypothetical protein
MVREQRLALWDAGSNPRTSSIHIVLPSCYSVTLRNVATNTPCFFPLVRLFQKLCWQFEFSLATEKLGVQSSFKAQADMSHVT